MVVCVNNGWPLCGASVPCVRSEAKRFMDCAHKLVLSATQIPAVDRATLLNVIGRRYEEVGDTKQAAVLYGTGRRLVGKPEVRS